MHKKWAMAVLLVIVAVMLGFAACQQSPAPAAQSQTAATPPPPPPPPETSQGTLVSVERADKVMSHVMFLTTSGVKSAIEEQKAEKGKTYVVLHFDKKVEEKPAAKKSGGLVELSSSGAGGRLESKGKKDAKLWLTDSTGKKYTEGIGITDKPKAHIAYMIPAEATGLVWHDGDNAYQLEPKIAPVKQ